MNKTEGVCSGKGAYFKSYISWVHIYITAMKLTFLYFNAVWKYIFTKKNV